jgi:hypothetical protein
MVRNKKFHVYHTDKAQISWSGKNDDDVSPTIIWAKDRKDAMAMLKAGNHNLAKIIIVEAKED